MSLEPLCLSPAARRLSLTHACALVLLCTSGKDEAASPVCVSEIAAVSACVDLCSLLCLCADMHIVHTCLCTHYWYGMLSLSSFLLQPGGHGAVAGSALSAGQIDNHYQKHRCHRCLQKL